MGELSWCELAIHFTFVTPVMVVQEKLRILIINRYVHYLTYGDIIVDCTNIDLICTFKHENT